MLACRYTINEPNEKFNSIIGYHASTQRLTRSQSSVSSRASLPLERVFPNASPQRQERGLGTSQIQRCCQFFVVCLPERFPFLNPFLSSWLLSICCRHSFVCLFVRLFTHSPTHPNNQSINQAILVHM